MPYFEYFSNKAFKKPVEVTKWRGESFSSRPNIIWKTQFDWLIFFVKRDFIGWHRVPAEITRYSLRVPSHLTMYSWQSVHLCYNVLSSIGMARVVFCLKT